MNREVEGGRCCVYPGFLDEALVPEHSESGVDVFHSFQVPLDCPMIQDVIRVEEHKKATLGYICSAISRCRNSCVSLVDIEDAIAISASDFMRSVGRPVVNDDDL